MNVLPTISHDEILRFATIKHLVYTLATLSIIKIIQISYDPVRQVFSPLRHLRGPKNKSILFGNMKQIFGAPSVTLYEEWMEKYGSTFAFRGFLLSRRLFTTDPRALSFVMTQNYAFAKPTTFRLNLTNLLGDSILFVEFDTHKRQRCIMNPSFGPLQVRELVPIFWQKSIKLKDIWLDIIKASPEGVAVIDILPWLSRATLDIIGAAGFDYHFNALEGEENELADAFTKIFATGPRTKVLTILKTLFPVLRIIPDEHSRIMDVNVANMSRIGTKIVEDKKAALSQELKTGSTAQSRDLLTLLIRANMASKSKDQRMTDEEVLGQISAFLIAGHETTSTSTTWALYALAKHPGVQRKLRHELLESALGDEPAMEDLDKLPYLDSVVREVLRIYAAVPGTVREAAHDIQIPVAKGFKDRYGVEHNYITLRKGDSVFLPILVMNRNREIWGEDAAQFRPERWDNLPEAVKDMPGVWGHLMTFFAGPRACIGYRFSVIEMKALLYSLIRAIEFDIDPSIEVLGKAGPVIRPYVVSEPDKGNQMPLICKAVVSI